MTTVALPQPTARCAASSFPAAWFSDDPEDREYAAWQCSACPLHDACASRAPFEAAGLWGGKEAGEGFELVEPPAPQHHASRASYVNGCRCGGCTDANAAWIREWRHRPTAVTSPETVGGEQLAFDWSAA